LWRFDLVHDPECGKQIHADCAVADMLILSAGESGAHPAVVEDWVSVFLSRRRSTSTAILSLFGCPDNWSISIQEGAPAEDGTAG
jgi:hypothetical protein